MLALQTWLQARLSDDTGAAMVEYALLVVLIAIVALVAVGLTGTAVSSTFNNVATHL